jgi:hypothetical protein
MLLPPATVSESLQRPPEPPEQEFVKMNVVIQSLADHGYTPFSFIERLLTTGSKYKEKDELVEKFPTLLEKLQTKDHVVDWAVRVTTRKCVTELSRMREEPALRGDAEKISLKTINNFNLEPIALKMQQHAPNLFAIITALLNIKQIRQTTFKNASGEEDTDRKKKWEDMRDAKKNIVSSIYVPDAQV